MAQLRDSGIFNHGGSPQRNCLFENTEENVEQAHIKLQYKVFFFN